MISIKEKIENNLTIILGGFIVAAGVGGWSLCSTIMMPIYTNKIETLERTLKSQPEYMEQAVKLQQQVNALNADLLHATEVTHKWQQSLSSWQESHKRLQSQNDQYFANCSLLTEMQKIEKNKGDVEESLTRVHYLAGQQEQIPMYERRVREYQARLISLSDKLSCIPR